MKTCLIFLLLALLATDAGAALKTVGHGDKLNIDPTMVTPEYQRAFDIMQKRCIKCHTMERTVVAVKTGIAPITGALFDRSATKAYGIKMLRKKDSGMNKSEVSSVVELLNFLLDAAQR